MALPTNQIAKQTQYANPTATLPVTPPIVAQTATGSGTVIDGQPHIDKHAPGAMGHNPGFK